MVLTNIHDIKSVSRMLEQINNNGINSVGRLSEQINNNDIKCVSRMSQELNRNDKYSQQTTRRNNHDINSASKL